VALVAQMPFSNTRYIIINSLVDLTNSAAQRKKIRYQAQTSCNPGRALIHTVAPNTDCAN
jgi:hypothetical protein